ncbi:MAG: glycolate oxidase FAD binding subunit [Gammaproteobacteria bacterium]|jgi:glycolate oxidase FAD binding subunit
MVENSIETDLAEQIQIAYANASPVLITGGGSKSFYGETITGFELDVSLNTGVIDYDPAELVITVRGGTKLSEVKSLLAEQGQILGFEPPEFGENATVAGAIASGLCGPRRAYAGNVRDFILGIKMIDGQGQVLSFGGRVIKNVAGFDLSRVMAGSLGSLGVILEASIKVIPAYEIEKTLRFQHEKANDHIQWINQLAGRPHPISASLWNQGTSWIRLSGSEQGIGEAQNRLGGEIVEDIWTSIREQTHHFFVDAPMLTRVSIKPATGHFDIESSPQMIEWGGAQRWMNENISVENLRRQLEPTGGTVCAFQNHPSDTAVFNPLPASILALQQRLKKSFDPAGILNPGKLYPEL